MKRILLLILLLSLIAYACGTGSAATPEDPGAANQPTTQPTSNPPTDTPTPLPPTPTRAPTDTPTITPTPTDTPTPEPQVSLEQVYRFQGRLLPQTTGSQISEGNFVAEGGPVYTVAFSPDGTLFVMGGRGDPDDDFDEQAGRLYDTVFLFDLTTGIQLWQLNPAKQGSKVIFDLVFHPAEPYLFGAYQDRSVLNWDLENGERENIFQDHRGSANAVAISPDGTLLAAAIADTVRLWSGVRGWAYGRPNPTLTLTLLDEESRAPFCDLAFSPDGTMLAAGTDTYIVFWNPVNGQELKVLNTGGIEIAFSPDGKYLAAASVSSLAIWDLENDTQMSVISLAANSLDYSPDGEMLAFTDDADIILWDIAGNRELTRTSAHTGPIHVICFSHDGQYLATGSEDTTAIVWKIIK